MFEGGSADESTHGPAQTELHAHELTLCRRPKTLRRLAVRIGDTRNPQQCKGGSVQRLHNKSKQRRFDERVCGNPRRAGHHTEHEQTMVTPTPQKAIAEEEHEHLAAHSDGQCVAHHPTGRANPFQIEEEIVMDHGEPEPLAKAKKRNRRHVGSPISARNPVQKAGTFTCAIGKTNAIRKQMAKRTP